MTRKNTRRHFVYHTHNSLSGRYFRPTVERLEHRFPPGDIGITGPLVFAEGSQLALELRSDYDNATLFNSRPEEWRGEGRISLFPSADEAAYTISPLPQGSPSSDLSVTGDESVYGLAAIEAPGIRHVMQSARPSLPVTHVSASLGGLMSAAPGNSFRVGGVQTPIPALRASVNQSPARRQGIAADPSQAVENRAKLDLAFEENVGQTDSRVDFVARTGGTTVFLTPAAAVFAVQNSESRIQNSEDRWRAGRVNALEAESTAGVAIHMQLVGANPEAPVAGVNPLETKVNYFIGNDASQWHANVPTFGRVEYDEVYPGIDLAYYGRKQQLEYDFIVAPGADANAIALSFAGADEARIDKHGNLVLQTAAGELVQEKPYLYQDINGTRREIPGSFILDTQHSGLQTQDAAQVRFQIGEYDPSHTLVIDPVVSIDYATYLGGAVAPGGPAFQGGRGIAGDAAGNAYVVGFTDALDFPTTPGAYDTTPGNGEAFITKIRADGTGLIYSTYLGGSGNDSALALAVDAGGNAYLSGFTLSSDFATTAGAWDTSYAGGGVSDAFVTKLNPTGTGLIYSTYLGGSFEDDGSGVAIDASGNAYVTGNTRSNDYPIVAGGFQTTKDANSDAFVTKLSANGTSLIHSNFLGGSGLDDGFRIAVDGSGNSYLTGRTNSSDFPTTAGAFDTTHNGNRDPFVTKVNAAGTALAYSTYLGGSGDFDFGHDIAVNASGNAYVTGRTDSANFPVTAGAFSTTQNGLHDGFVTKLRADGAGLLYSTFLGGNTNDEGNSIALDSNGSAYIGGLTWGGTFPITPGSYQPVFGGPNADAFMTIVRPDGTNLLYSTFLGGLGQDEGNAIAVKGNNVFVTGLTSTNNFPVTPGAYDTVKSGVVDTFVAKFCRRACRVSADATPVAVIP